MTTFKQLIDQLTSIDLVSWTKGERSGENTVNNLRKDSGELLESIVFKIKADGTVCLIDRLETSRNCWYILKLDGRYYFYHVDGGIAGPQLKFEELKAQKEEFDFFKLSISNGWYVIVGEEYFDTKEEFNEFYIWCKKHHISHPAEKNKRYLFENRRK